MSAPLTILEGMPAWIRTGIAPAAADLHAAGLTDGWQAQVSMRADMFDGWWHKRRVFNIEYGFSIPTAEAIAALVALSPLVEVGAGSGYWSAILTAAGADVVATDRGPSSYGFELAQHHPIKRMGAVAAVKANPERNVFCSWPCYGADWPAKAAKAMAPGRTLALIGEGEDGCTGSGLLFRVLERDFEEAVDVPSAQFPGLHDRMTLHRKRAA